MAQAQSKPIDFYYWTTPNGWKVSIMLEECGLPYSVHPVNIAKREQYEADFLAHSPNNKIPAIVDPEGPGGRPISVFESGAILQYLGRKTAQFYPTEERARVSVDEWLFWQVSGLGPTAAQTHHFRLFAPEKIPYAIERFTNECTRLYGVMDARLAAHPYLAGDTYSIADIASIGWTSAWERQGQNPNQFPNVKRWLEQVKARPAVKRGLALAAEARQVRP
jgi:GSH-dependent disulfide-bond oxidoreductase